MENKKTFGAYICRRRKELGLTQREFADRLFVTESAVGRVKIFSHFSLQALA